MSITPRAIAPRIHVDLVASSYLLFAALFAGLTVLFYVTDCQQALARGHVHALAAVTAVFAVCGLAIVRTARPSFLADRPGSNRPEAGAGTDDGDQRGMFI